MNRIDLAYGMTQQQFEYDADQFQLLVPPLFNTTLGEDQIREKLNRPTNSDDLVKLASENHSALIIVSDPTRITRADLLLPIVIDQLNAGGIEDKKINILIARGNHRAISQDEIECTVGPETANRIAVHQHDSSDEASLQLVGSTSRGTEIKLNRLLFQHDLVIVISTIMAHYFAGFGGGRKSIFPGVAGRNGIIANHLLSIDFSRGKLAQGVEPCRLAGNPVNEDLIECASKRKPDFVINTLLNPDHQIGDLFCGHWRDSHEVACKAFLDHHGVRIQERRQLVVASCGGSPKDIDLIQSHKSIQYASRALSPGGSLILLAECTDGIGSKGFDRFFPIRDVFDHLQYIQEKNPANGQTALAMNDKAREFDIHFVSELKAELAKEIGMTPHKNLASALNTLGTKAPATQGYIIPVSAQTIPLL